MDLCFNYDAVNHLKRWMYARNWDDFLQRDCKAFTFPRAFAIWAAASLGFATGNEIKLAETMEIAGLF